MRRRRAARRATAGGEEHGQNESMAARRCEVGLRLIRRRATAKRPKLGSAAGAQRSASRGRAIQMPATMTGARRAPGPAVTASPRIAQANTAAVIASRKMTSDEKTAGSRPSATDSKPWPPAWLTRPGQQHRPAAAPSGAGNRGSSSERHDEEDRGRDEAHLEGDARRAGMPARAARTARKYRPKNMPVATPERSPITRARSNAKLCATSAAPPEQAQAETARARRGAPARRTAASRTPRPRSAPWWRRRWRWRPWCGRSTGARRTGRR